MFSQNDDGQQAFALGLVFTVAALAVALVLGVGISARRAAPPAPVAMQPQPAAPALPPVVVPAPAIAATVPLVAVPPPTQSGVMVESGTVRFYFASGSSELAAGADAALAGVIAYGKGGRTLVISGFHDASGSIAGNAGLARKRAAAVRDALLRAGVPASLVLLQKPVQAEAGSDAEARRVDITVQ